MIKVKAIVVGDIPAHRLLWLYGSEDGTTLHVGLPKRGGDYVDFVSTRALEDGEEIVVTIKDNVRVWTAEAANDIPPGGNIAADTDGRVGLYPSALIRVGYALHSAKEGELVQFVREPKVNRPALEQFIKETAADMN